MPKCFKIEVAGRLNHEFQSTLLLSGQLTRALKQQLQRVTIVNTWLGKPIIWTYSFGIGRDNDGSEVRTGELRHGRVLGVRPVDA